DVAVALRDVAPGRLRMELLETADGVTVLNDSYNANPTSMEAALVALSHFDIAPGGRRIAVLGDMRELGAHHDDAHAQMGECAQKLGIDVVVGVGAGGRAIAAATGSTETETVADADAAAAVLADLVRAGDVVLVKGSRALRLERVATALLDRRGD